MATAACTHNGLAGRMPIEILAFILNGHTRAPPSPHDAHVTWDQRFDRCTRDSCAGAAKRLCAATASSADGRLCRPLLDPRWRFAARATCRLWRDIVQQPSLSDAAVLSAHDPLSRRGPPHDQTLRAAWLSGRIVCASAAADFIRAHRDTWAHTPDAAVAWCIDETNAMRKQAVVALVASGVAWAVDHVIDSQWPRLMFCSVLAHSLRGCGDKLFQSMSYHTVYKEHATCEVDYRDGSDHPAALAAALVAVSLRHGSHAHFCALCEAIGHTPRPVTSALHAIKGNQPDVLTTLLRNHHAVASESRLWCAAAASADPACFACLLELSPTPPCAPPGTESRLAEWLADAVCMDRHSVIRLCDAKGIAFDRTEAFALAARHGSTRAMALLAPTLGVPIDHDTVHASAVRAMGKGRKPFDDDTVCGIAWLADVLGYAPRCGTDDMRQLVDRACATGNASCRLVYVAERWHLAFAALPCEVIRAAFIQSSIEVIHDPIRMAGHLAMVLDRAHACDTDATVTAAAIDKLDLWGAIISRLDVDGYGPTATATLFVRALCGLIVGHAPPPIDVASATGLYDRIRACADGNKDGGRGERVARTLEPFERALCRWCVPRTMRDVDLFPAGVACATRSWSGRIYAAHVLKGLADHGLLGADGAI
ncbi:hypothetical protein pkur_cds_363 [Pandoravirus kuranda]|uniref:F-box incomplete domain containing protein n=1 Tax=Pandoravirus kuranda TaxID=3019033 RepID=A0AA95EGM2_9VIRU|nr:hypothetical protein pkur_cds_363 [Pandoravirus kuranda]